MILIVVAGGVVYIYLYTSVADNRYLLEGLKENIVAAEIANAELKNDLYQKIDPVKLEEVALDRNLVLDKNPDYFEVHQWVSDSSY